MVRSLYVLNYFENMKQWYEEQGLIFDNWNNRDLIRRDDGMIPGKDLFYVPKSHAEHLAEHLARYALTRSIKEPGEPWIYLGWNVGATNALDGTRSHHIQRKVPVGESETTVTPKGIPEGSSQIKWFRECTWELSVFMMTNHGNVAEDLEELYESRIQMKSEIPVDMGSVFIMDYPNFMINTQHKTLQTSNPILTKGNLWGLKYDVTLTGPAIEFSEKQIAAAKSLSITLYDMGRQPAVELDTLRTENQ
jgi:hypothetical protein